MKIEDLPHFEVSVEIVEAKESQMLTGQLSGLSEIRADISINKSNSPFAVPELNKEYILIEKKILERNLKKPKSSNPLMAEFESFD